MFLSYYVVESDIAREYRGEEVEPIGVIEACAAMVTSVTLYFGFISPVLTGAFSVLSTKLFDLEGYPSTLNRYLGAGFVLVCIVAWLVFRGYGNLAEEMSESV